MKESRFSQFDILLGSAAKAVQRLKSTYMDKYQLSAAHTDCLYRLLENEQGLTQMDLVRLEGMDKSQVSRVLKTLVKEGYVTKEAGGYKQPYFLTEKGKTIAREVQATILNINRYVSQSLSAQEIISFYKTFQTIVDHLNHAAELSLENHNSFREELSEK